jgi:asparagine synthetase B (glutamine-hydrolysing)
MASTIHGMVRWGARAGAEVRIPYLDVRLVERILAIPWEHRFPRGDTRRLGRDALGDLLPVEFQSRRDQGSWAPVWERHARLCLPLLARLMGEGEWLSEPFVLRAEAAKLLKVAQHDSAQTPRIISEFWVLEAWVRYLLRTVPCAVY